MTCISLSTATYSGLPLVSGDNDDDDDDNGNNDADSDASSQVLFASQYELTGNNTEPYAASLEVGDVCSFSDGDFYWVEDFSCPFAALQAADYEL